MIKNNSLKITVNDSNATNAGLGPGLILAPAAAALAAAASGADGEPVVVSRSGVGGTGRNSGGKLFFSYFT